MPALDPGRETIESACCGATADRYHRTVDDYDHFLDTYRCSDCGARGTISRAAGEGVVSRIGPAVDPDHSAPRSGAIRADGGETVVDDRRVYLAPAGNGRWFNADPGRFHTSESCAARGYGSVENVREVFLERAVKEGYTACGICAKDVELRTDADPRQEGPP